MIPLTEKVTLRSDRQPTSGYTFAWQKYQSALRPTRQYITPSGHQAFLGDQATRPWSSGVSMGQQLLIPANFSREENMRLQGMTTTKLYAES